LQYNTITTIAKQCPYNKMQYNPYNGIQYHELKPSQRNALKYTFKLQLQYNPMHYNTGTIA